MNGWIELDDGSGYYTPTEPTVADVIAKLAQLPPDTIVETDGGGDEASGVWYYPGKEKAVIL